MQVSRPSKFGPAPTYPMSGYQPSFQMGPPSINGAATMNAIPMQVPQMNTFAPSFQSRLPYTLTVRYGDQKENRIENVERNRKMNLLLSHPEIPENAKIEVPAELRAEQKEWNKMKKETEALSQRKYKLEVSVLNEEKGKVEQCAKCRKSNESKTRSFVRVRSSHIYCKNRSISLPVKFGCIPSHQDNRPKELFIEIKLINENPERLEFYALVPLRFRKHKRKRSAKASPLTSPGTTSPINSPLTSPRGMSLSPWGINQLHPPELQTFTSWPTIEDSKHVPMGYPPNTNPTVHWALPHEMTGPQFEMNADVHFTREGGYGFPHAKGSHLDHMIESPHQSPPCSPGGPGSPGTFLSGYGSPPYDDFDFSLNKLPHGVEIEQLPAYLQRLRVHELEDKNRRLEDETAACRRMLDECKRVLKTATMEIERLTKENQRLNFALSHKDQELDTERRIREQTQKQFEEINKATKSGSKFLQSSEKPRASASSGSVSASGGSFISSNKNPFTAKEDIDAVRRNLKPVEWNPNQQQQESSMVEFTCKARVSTSGNVQQQPQGKTAPGQPQFSFGFTSLPLFNDPRS
eukprot:TRINITY_DN2458_c0_g1_i1.p1 TRINITY_DN2458_c0_g1~~TRINITY_DN2458_c0_g1_i1.p1  ORF type:complete len:578 (-),score=128.69 TRINITY_DN2458_c0_g1_i1:185-1918(-)